MTIYELIKQPNDESINLMVPNQDQHERRFDELI
jgi:hypothetical protein